MHGACLSVCVWGGADTPFYYYASWRHRRRRQRACGANKNKQEAKFFLFSIPDTQLITCCHFEFMISKAAALFFIVLTTPQYHATGWGVRKAIFSRAKKAIASTSIFVSSISPFQDSAKKSTMPTSSILRKFENRQHQSATSYNLENLRASGEVTFVRNAVQEVGPSVLRIDCLKDIHSSADGGTVETVRICGSGIVLSPDGYIMTNEHVVSRSRRVTITTSDGRVYKAKVIATDELTDLAVLKADVGSDVLPVAKLGDSNDLRSGDWVIAVGCPVGLDFTVTLGVVSNPKRSAHEVGVPHMKGSFIQTDAALNHGIQSFSV